MNALEMFSAKAGKYSVNPNVQRTVVGLAGAGMTAVMSGAASVGTVVVAAAPILVPAAVVGGIAYGLKKLLED